MLEVGSVWTPRTCERLYSVCAYILHVYTAGTGHTRMQHAHACAAKQSELVRRCIATTALFALSGVHPAGGLGPPPTWTRLSLPVSRHNTNKLILEHALALFVVRQGKGNCLSSLSRQCSRDPFGKPWNCVSCREIDRVNCAPVGERVPDLRSYRPGQST